VSERGLKEGRMPFQGEPGRKRERKREGGWEERENARVREKAREGERESLCV